PARTSIMSSTSPRHCDPSWSWRRTTAVEEFGTVLETPPGVPLGVPRLGPGIGSERRPVMTERSAVYRFAAALGLYVLWIGALAALAIVSGSRPATITTAPLPSAIPTDVPAR